jgi:hypothetical protein
MGQSLKSIWMSTFMVFKDVRYVCNHRRFQVKLEFFVIEIAFLKKSVAVGNDSDL